MEFNIPVRKNDLVYKSILRLFNFSLNLTENELDLVSDILVNNLSILNEVNRKKLRELEGKNYSFYSINNYVASLKKKNVLVILDNTLQIHPNILETIKHNTFTFNFNVIK